MKSLRYSLFVSAVAVTLSGCASSERMIRNSAGVFDEYSAPKSHRIRSEKFQKNSEAMGKPRDHKDHDLTGQTKNIVNIWPFFFKNQDYVSALWPMIDYDPYGWAVRPFYNQEGDDCSILFPLSSWNTQSKSGWVLNCIFEPGFFSFIPLSSVNTRSKSGWVLNCIFEPDFFSFFPLTWHSCTNSKTFFWYTPLLIHSGSSTKDFTEFCLAYWGGSKYECYGGFFPLLHIGTDDSGWNCSSFIWLFEAEKEKHRTEVSCLGPLLGSYSSEYFPDSTSDVSEKSFSSVCLLSGFRQNEFYKDNPEKTACNTLQERSYEAGFNCRSESVLNELKKIHPDAVKDMPETVVNGETFRTYLKELIQKRKGSWSIGSNKAGGFLPVFYFNSRDDGYYEWFSLPILSYHESSPRKEEGSFGLFLPALSWYKTSAWEDYSFILAGLGGYCCTDRNAQERRYELPIHESDRKWADRWNQQEYEDQYYCLGLFYRGKDRFYVAKPGLNGDPQELKTALIRAVKNFKTLQYKKKNLAAREGQNREQSIETKIEHYQQLIEKERIRIAGEKNVKQRQDLTKQVEEFRALIEQYYQELIEEERIRIAREENEKQWQDFMEQVAEIRALAEDLNFKLPEDFYTDPGNIQLLGNRIMDELAELRGHEDIGHGIVFRKEKFYNGDYNWRFLGFLAGGEKNGEYEKTHVCHLLYRYTKQGNKEETLCFPFIAKGKDGDDTYFSFLWRVFDVETKGGKTSGHVLFIPFGE